MSSRHPSLSPGLTKPAWALLCCIGTLLVTCGPSLAAPTTNSAPTANMTKIILAHLKLESKKLYEDYVSALEVSFSNHFFKCLILLSRMALLSRCETSCSSQGGMGKNQTGCCGDADEGGQCTNREGGGRLVKGPRHQPLPPDDRMCAQLTAFLIAHLPGCLCSHRQRSCWKHGFRDGPAPVRNPPAK